MLVPSLLPKPAHLSVAVLPPESSDRFFHVNEHIWPVSPGFTQSVWEMPQRRRHLSGVLEEESNIPPWRGERTLGAEGSAAWVRVDCLGAWLETMEWEAVDLAGKQRWDME